MWTEYQIKKLLSIHKSKALEWAFSPCQEYQFTNTFWSRLYSGQLRMPHSQLIKKISFAISKSNKDVWSDSLRKSIRNRKLIEVIQFSSVQFSHSVLSNSLWPHGLQHTSPPYPSPTPRAYSNSYPLSRWCHPTISTFVVPFSSCLQSFPASGSFPVSQFFTLGSQSIGASAHQYFQFRIDFL